MVRGRNRSSRRDEEREKEEEWERGERQWEEGKKQQQHLRLQRGEGRSVSQPLNHSVSIQSHSNRRPLLRKAIQSQLPVLLVVLLRRARSLLSVLCFRMIFSPFAPPKWNASRCSMENYFVCALAYFLLAFLIHRPCCSPILLPLSRPLRSYALSCHRAGPGDPQFPLPSSHLMSCPDPVLPLIKSDQLITTF